MTEALDAARSAYSKWYTIQSRVAVLANAFLILAQPVKLSTVSRRAPRGPATARAILGATRIARDSRRATRFASASTTRDDRVPPSASVAVCRRARARERE